MVAIFVIDNIFRFSDNILNSKLSIIIEIVEGRDVVLIIIGVFGFSYLLGDSKWSIIARISGIRLAIFEIGDFFEFSDHLRNIKRIFIFFLIQSC